MVWYGLERRKRGGGQRYIGGEGIAIDADDKKEKNRD